MTLDELESQLRSFKQVTPDFPVVIKGDRVAQFGRVTEVLDVCGRVGITQLGIVTERTKA